MVGVSRCAGKSAEGSACGKRLKEIGAKASGNFPALEKISFSLLSSSLTIASGKFT